MLVQLDVTGQRKTKKKNKEKKRRRSKLQRKRRNEFLRRRVRLQMGGFQKQKDAGTLNELPRFVEAAVQK